MESKARASRLPIEVIPIHFDVPEHQIALETFIETAAQTRAIITAFNQELLGGELKFELLVLPPERGSFKSRLGISVIAWGAVWAFCESDIGKAFVRGLTGHEPAYWFEIAGERLKQQFTTVTEAATHSDQVEEIIRSEVIITEITKSFMQKDIVELKLVGIEPQKFRDAYEARNKFYVACAENHELKGIGFSDVDEFPIKRKDFAGLQVALPSKEDEVKEGPWHVEIAVLKVTSPNWAREDQQRQWKGKDINNKDRYFRIEDDDFWGFVQNKELNPHIIDTLKVQWALRDDGPRYKAARVLKVLEYNGQILGQPLETKALDTLFDQYHEPSHADNQADLFSERV